MNNCTISNNTSYGNGGGLYCYSYEYYGERKVTIFELNECILSNNTASANGGGIYNKGEFNVINSEIFNNNASNGGGIYSISGFNYSNFLKQISIYGSEVTGTAISNNKAIGFGGGVFCTSDISLEGKIDISNNFASRGTNNLLCDSEDSSIELNNITQSSIGISLFNNSSIAVGQITSTGDQYIQSFFPDNSKTSIVASDGGLCLKLKTSSQDVARIVTGSCVATFSSVQAAVDAAASGDAIELLSDSYENAVIVSNTALSLDLKGFVISGDFNGGDNIFEIINHGNLTIKDTGSGTRNHYFLFNKDYAWGWDDSVSIGSITIDDVNNSTALWTPVKLSRGCITGGNAGGIYISSNSTLNLEDAAIIGCCVDGCGAGIYNNGKVIINDALIAGNSAGDEGAGVYNSCEAFIDNTIFHSNTCIDDGAGIYNYNGGMITISGGAFSYNKADEAGGIYNEYNGIITMSGVNFVYNVSVEEGGALKNNGDINIFGGSFVGNRNEIEGGAIYNSERMSLYDVLVECNYSGQYGGGIYNSDTLVVSNCAIKDNSSIMGGGLFNSEGTCYINGGKVVGNTLHSGGNMGAGVLNAGDLVLSGEVDISGNAYGEIKSNLAELKMDGYGCFTSISFGNDGIFGNSNIGTTLLTMISQFTIGPTSGDIAEEGAEYAEYFFADDDDYEVVENAPGLALVQAAPVNVTLHATNGTINKFQGDSVKAGSRVTSDGGILQIGSVTYIASANDGYKFSKWTVSPNANVITTNTSITATFEVIPSVIQYVNTGGGGGAANYAVGKNAVQNGTLTLSQTSAEGGTSIKVTAVPNKGYKLKTLSVQDGLGNAIAYTVDSSTEYHFVMPARKVTVSAEFEKETVKAECTRDDNCVIAKFEDLSPARWYHEGIHFCVERGYMEGETKTKFNPFGTLNRGMMVRLLYNIDGKPAVSGPSTFTDVASGRWFTDAIAWAEANKLIEGNGKGQFNLEGDMTREMLITLMYNYAKLKGCDVSKTGSLEKYPDASKLSKWSVDAFKWATANGIMDGKSDGTLDPKGSATRVEAAVLIQQFMEVFEK